MKRSKIVVDASRCVGAGQCVLASPAVFSQSEETGLVLVLQENPAPEVMKSVEHAVYACPSNALTLVTE